MDRLSESGTVRGGTPGFEQASHWKSPSHADAKPRPACRRPYFFG